MVVGAPYDSDAEFESGLGSVFVYMEVKDNEWELVGDKITSGGNSQTLTPIFGYSVDIDEESRIVIGELAVSYLEKTFRASVVFS